MKVKLFNALSKQSKNEGTLQGIIYPNGKVEIGIDVWRDLNSFDFSSHRVYRYDSIKEAKNYYNLIKIRKYQYFYISDVEGKENDEQF